jgi:hypothetical protein
LGYLQPAQGAEEAKGQVSSNDTNICFLIPVAMKRADLNESGNRFRPLEDGLIFEGVTELHLEETLLSWDEVCQASKYKLIIPGTY